MTSRKDGSKTGVPTLSQGAHRQPTMGLLDAINLLLACIIGSGIFISAKAVLEFSGSYGLSVVVWIGCGLLCILVTRLTSIGHCVWNWDSRARCATPSSAARMSRRAAITRTCAWHSAISSAFYVCGSRSCSRDR